MLGKTGNDVPFHTFLGLSYYKLGDFKNAYNEFKPLTRVNPPRADIWQLYMDSAYKIGRLDELPHACKVVVSLRPDLSYNIVTNVGIKLCKSGNYKIAEQIANELHGLDSQAPFPYALRAVILREFYKDEVKANETFKQGKYYSFIVDNRRDRLLAQKLSELTQISTRVTSKMFLEHMGYAPAKLPNPEKLIMAIAKKFSLMIDGDFIILERFDPAATMKRFDDEIKALGTLEDFMRSNIQARKTSGMTCSVCGEPLPSDSELQFCTNCGSKI